MKRLVILPFLMILILYGLLSNASVNRPASASSCAIATYSAPIGNGTISYNQVGTGQPILLLHGLFADKEQWSSMMCQLSMAGYQAIAPDLPGYGSSIGFTTRDYTLENQVKLLHKLTNQLEIHSFDVAGSSMGGAIAILYSQRYPEQLLSLAFIGSPLGIADWASSVRNSIKDGINPFIPITQEQFDLEISLLFVTPPTIPDSVKTEKVKDYITRNRHYQKIWDIINLYDDVLCQTQRRSPQLPTLAIWGIEDKIYDIRGASRLQRCIPRSQVIRLPKAGHLLLIENAKKATANYLQFLSKIKN
ncbi:putative hydrolase or acyltransferase of alpha/beta superfamily [Rivularia sp. PCC 7116]|uniref:alpha/beta fold hydrolase n=1 Tax=Rivularia sp. PCC 7116 TaxID=373994 RepID=UPI00029EE0E2|nr:alpha/beta hydrolase [Rivularia sp. PCC 7116]AFY56756.1 putative hydrolase or acyltransferase of alpha/beta superfamily [Rivularia sp. PCC 7116]